MRLLSLGFLVGSLAAPTAVAQGRGGSETPDRPPVDRAALDAAVASLQDADLVTVLNAISQLAEFADARATQPLIRLLRAGPPDDVTHAAIQALGAISDPESVDVLIEYMRHRRARVRRLAVQSIAMITAARVADKVNEALRQALRDSNDRVRGAAAMALGEHGDRGALDVLFLAWERNVPEAAVAIGKLGGPAEAQRLAGFLGRRQLSEILPGFDEFLRRSDFSDDAKIDLIHRLEETAGPDVKRFLTNLLASPPPGLSQKVKDEAQRVIRIIPDAI
ncbi:MAG: HEAT repeat domain-containing protein [Deltaproteobacteria bacterium]|nr:HEAT repeat domain-containing protein [Deltaproteobacteria bacterium]